MPETRVTYRVGVEGQSDLERLLELEDRYQRLQQTSIERSEAQQASYRNLQEELQRYRLQIEDLTRRGVVPGGPAVPGVGPTPPGTPRVGPGSGGPPQAPSYPSPGAGVPSTPGGGVVAPPSAPSGGGGVPPAPGGGGGSWGVVGQAAQSIGGGVMAGLGVGPLAGLATLAGLGAAVGWVVAQWVEWDRVMTKSRMTLGDVRGDVERLGGAYGYTHEQVAGYYRSLAGTTGRTGARGGRDVGALIQWGRATGQDPGALMAAGPAARMTGFSVDDILGYSTAIGTAGGILDPREGNFARFEEALSSYTGAIQMASAYRLEPNANNIADIQAGLAQYGEGFTGQRGLGILGRMQAGFQTTDPYKRAFLYRAVRQSGLVPPGADQVALEEQVERGFEGGNVQAVIAQIQREGYGRQGGTFALRDLFGLTTQQARTIMDDPSRIQQGMTGRAILDTYGLTRGELEQRAAEGVPFADSVTSDLHNTLVTAFHESAGQYIEDLYSTVEEWRDEWSSDRVAVAANPALAHYDPDDPYEVRIDQMNARMAKAHLGWRGERLPSADLIGAVQPDWSVVAPPGMPVGDTGPGVARIQDFLRAVTKETAETVKQTPRVETESEVNAIVVQMIARYATTSDEARAHLATLVELQRVANEIATSGGERVPRTGYGSG